MLRGVTEPPRVTAQHVVEAAPELRPLEVHPALPPPTSLNPLGKSVDTEPCFLPAPGSYSAPRPQELILALLPTTSGLRRNSSRSGEDQLWRQQPWCKAGPGHLGLACRSPARPGPSAGGGRPASSGGGPASPAGVCPGVMSQSILSLDRPLQSGHSPTRALRSWTQWKLSCRALYKENAGLLQRGNS